MGKKIRLRLTGGSLKGKRVFFPHFSSVRPTKSQVREAFFSIVGQQLKGKTFLDGFGGSGVMGMEAYSRGAIVHIVEKHSRVAQAIQKNVALHQMAIQVYQGDVLKLKERFSPVDIVFLDPPYGPQVEHYVMSLLGITQSQLIIEAEYEVVEPPPKGWKLKVKRYGSSFLWCYTKLKESS